MHRHSIGGVFAIVLGLAIGSADAATLYVGANGLDGATCGTKTAPCRSITATIAAAAPDDKILVGPGRYGDIDADGTVGDVGEETPAPGCGCVLAVNKPVSITSTGGAASTIVYARFVGLNTTVLVIADGSEFGAPGKGFTVTNTAANPGAGIVIDSQNVAIRGNQVVLLDDAKGFGRIGIETVDFLQTMLIEANEVSEWGIGIRTRVGKIVRNNKLVGNRFGISATGGEVVRNVVVSNGDVGGSGAGIRLDGPTMAVGNTVHGNAIGFIVQSGFTGVVEKNNISGNVDCGLSSAAPVLNTSRNYWGSATGPGSDPADDVCDATGGGSTVTVLPFATKPFSAKVQLQLVEARALDPAERGKRLAQARGLTTEHGNDRLVRRLRADAELGAVRRPEFDGNSLRRGIHL